ncbi:MAG: hypothetical protein EX271_12745, partial [Acidimicrobiales bacterium]
PNDKDGSVAAEGLTDGTRLGAADAYGPYRGDIAWDAAVSASLDAYTWYHLWSIEVAEASTASIDLTGDLDGDTVEADLLAPTLASRLVYYGNDEELAAEFARKGAEYLGLDGDADKKALSSKVRTLGLAQVFEKRPEDSLPALMDLLKNGSPAEKSSALSAIGSIEDPEVATMLRAQVLSDKDAFTNRQASGVIAGLMGNEGTKDETWVWLKTNFDAFVEDRVLDVRKGGTPGYARWFCSKEKAKEVEAFFEEKAALVPGYERRLAQTLESINLCAALKKEKSTELVEALAAR